MKKIILSVIIAATAFAGQFNFCQNYYGINCNIQNPVKKIKSYKDIKLLRMPLYSQVLGGLFVLGVIEHNGRPLPFQMVNWERKNLRLINAYANIICGEIQTVNLIKYGKENLKTKRQMKAELNFINNLFRRIIAHKKPTPNEIAFFKNSKFFKVLKQEGIVKAKEKLNKILKEYAKSGFKPFYFDKYKFFTSFINNKGADFRFYNTRLLRAFYLRYKINLAKTNKIGNKILISVPVTIWKYALKQKLPKNELKIIKQRLINVVKKEYQTIYLNGR